MPSGNPRIHLAARARRRPAHLPKAAPVHPFDRLYGTDTGGLIPRAQLLTGHANDPHITAYYAVAPSILEQLLDLWQQTHPPYAIDRYTFLDVGAGKGRALLTAAQHPVLEATGIELNPALAAIARQNIRLFEAHPESHALAPLSLLEGDALEAPLPDSPTVAFLFHPFEAPMVRRFLARVQQHYAVPTGTPSRFDLLYVNSEHAAVIEREPGFTRKFFGHIPMSAIDHLADLAEIEGQQEYGSTGDEVCAIYRLEQNA
jgi:SAM-dependent methyltransferase